MSHKNLARQALPGNCRLQVRRSQPGCASHGYMAVCQAVGRIPAQFQRNRRNSAQTARNRRKRRNSAQSAQSAQFGAIQRKSRISSAFGAFQRTRRNPAHGQLPPLSPHALMAFVLSRKPTVCKHRRLTAEDPRLKVCLSMCFSRRPGECSFSFAALCRGAALYCRGFQGNMGRC